MKIRFTIGVLFVAAICVAAQVDKNILKFEYAGPELNQKVDMTKLEFQCTVLSLLKSAGECPLLSHGSSVLVRAREWKYTAEKDKIVLDIRINVLRPSKRYPTRASHERAYENICALAQNLSCRSAKRVSDTRTRWDRFPMLVKLTDGRKIIHQKTFNMKEPDMWQKKKQ